MKQSFKLENTNILFTTDIIKHRTRTHINYCTAKYYELQIAFPSIISSFMATAKYSDRTSYTIIKNKL